MSAGLIRPPGRAQNPARQRAGALPPERPRRACFHANWRVSPRENGPTLPWPSGMREEPVFPAKNLCTVTSSVNPHHNHDPYGQPSYHVMGRLSMRLSDIKNVTKEENIFCGAQCGGAGESGPPRSPSSSSQGHAPVPAVLQAKKGDIAPSVLTSYSSSPIGTRARSTLCALPVFSESSAARACALPSSG